MRLKKLEIFGFKSFAKRTEIIFEQNITGIVGPNGSGKSNIADAVRWVLGEQSAKMLRGNQMADVIFNGTEKKKSMHFCEVTLVFDNSDGKLSISFDEVSVTRRVYRSGESEYLVNGSQCRLKDIVEMFRDTGIGKEGYSIIGQGRIDEILSQRSEDRRTIFEEAAGISRFRNRKNEAETRLARTEENLLRVSDLLEELNLHMLPLEKQAKSAQKFLTLQDNLRQVDIALYLHRYNEHNEKEQNANLALAEANMQFAKIENEVLLLEQSREQHEVLLQNLLQSLKEANVALLATNDAYYSHQQEKKDITNEIQTHNNTLIRLKAEKEKYITRKNLLESTVDSGEKEINEAKQCALLSEEALKNAEAVFNEKTIITDKLDAELSAHKEKMLQSVTQMQSIKEQQARQSTLLQQISLRLSEIEQQAESEKNNQFALNENVALAKLSLENEEKNLQLQKLQVEALENTTQNLLNSFLEKQNKLQELVTKAQAAQTRFDTLTELKAGYEGYQYSVKNAITYAKQNKLYGIHDVVAELIKVPKELETALDMALGGTMQNIVCATEQDAKTIIEYLKKNKMGRATFLPLSTVRPRILTPKERNVLSLEGCLGVASELCKFDEKFRPIMENLLGRTLIAKDLQSGIAIMKAGGHAFRLVTLQGEVMHSGGSITGGSITQRAQNLLGREREREELKQALVNYNNQLEQLQNECKNITEQRTQAKNERDIAQQQILQQEIAIVRDQERLSTAKLACSQSVEKSNNFTQVIVQLNQNQANIQKELDQLQTISENRDSDASLEAIQADLALRLNTARRERENATEQLTNSKLTLQTAKHDLDRILQDQNRSQHDIDNLTVLLNDNAQGTIQTKELLLTAQKNLEIAEDREVLTAQEVEIAKKKVTSLEIENEKSQQKRLVLQSDYDHAQKIQSQASDKVNKCNFALNRIQGELTLINERIWDNYELTYALAEEEYRHNISLQASPSAFDYSEASTKATQLREQIKALGTVYVGAIEEYAKLHERFTSLNTQKQDIEQAQQDLQTLISQLLSEMQTIFINQFSTLQEYFTQTFTRLFGGGKGEILLSDPSAPLTCGIDIIVQPPGKKRQLLSLFSGGERALTAIALLFAMLKLKPTPFCILDEIEAALDEANVSYFADYLKEFSSSTQFVVVTHRKGTMERCDTLFGVAMQDKGISDMVSVNLTDYQ